MLTTEANAQQVCLCNVGGSITLHTYKDYKHGSVKKEMTLEAFEFLRRYSMHILPKGLVRIRHYGILSSTSKKQAAICIKEQLPKPKPLVKTTPSPPPYNPRQCPCCKEETMHALMHFNHRGPPANCMVLAADMLYAVV